MKILEIIFKKIKNFFVKKETQVNDKNEIQHVNCRCGDLIYNIDKEETE